MLGSRKHSIRIQRGAALIELLVALALTTLLLPALITGFVSARQGKVQQIERSQATMLVREAREAMRVIRERGWEYVSINGTYHPEVSGSIWALVPGAETINSQTRSIVIDDVYRDASGAIVSQGGTIDPSIKAITITVSWSSLFPSSVTSLIYLSRFTNQVYTQTSQSDFTSGILVNSTITNINGGEVTLGAGGGGDWCSPNLSIAASDLPKSGVANAVTSIEGRIFAGTGDNASGVSFANVTISDDSPPVASISGEFDGYKTNGVFGESNYAYIATDTNTKEIVIIDLTSYNPTTGKYSEIGYFDAPGNGNGNSVYVMGNIGYMTSGNTFYAFDISSKSGSRSPLDTDGVSLAGTGVRVMIVGNYAYIAIDSTGTQLEIVDVSNPSNLVVIGTAQLNAQGAVDVFVNQTATRAYLATKSSTTQRELFILDISTKTGNHASLGSYDTSGMNPKGITVVPGNRAIIVGIGGEEYQAISILNDAAPTYCGGLNIDSGVNGVSSILESDGDAYSYIITGDANSELKIIEGGPGGQYATSGTFTSPIFDATKSATFNRFDVHSTVPDQATIRYQFAITDEVSGDCSASTYTFVGPDKTDTTYFATSSALPLSSGGLYKNPARCLRYKVFLDTQDRFQSPIFEDITINYSP